MGEHIEIDIEGMIFYRGPIEPLEMISLKSIAEVAKAMLYSRRKEDFAEARITFRKRKF